MSPVSVMEAAKPLIEKVAPLPVPPFVLDSSIYDGMAETALLEQSVVQPLRKQHVTSLIVFQTIDIEQLHGRSQGSDQATIHSLRQLPIEVSKPITPKIQWAHSEAQQRSDPTVSKQIYI